LATLLAGSFLAMRFAGTNFLLILLVAGILNLIIEEGLPRLGGEMRTTPAVFVLLTGLAFADSRAIEISWLLFKTGLFSFGGAYASLVFIQRGAVDQYHWLSAGQLLDGVALSVATPGPFMLFGTFVGYIAGGIVGAALATFFVFLPSFVFVLVGARYVEQLRNNRPVQSFLSGVSAAVVGVILVVSLDFAPEALASLPMILIAVVSFLIIVLLKADVAYVAVGAMIAGVVYAATRAISG
jgi:chromate transporter